MEGDKDDRAIAYIIERDSFEGLYYPQEWYGMKPTTPNHLGRHETPCVCRASSRTSATPT